jgi:hypothetical protein
MEELIILEKGKPWRSFFAVLAFGFLLGSMVVGYLWRIHHTTVEVPKEAFRQAREAIESDMKVACSNWFTDKKMEKLPSGRIVVCRAPDWLSLPINR